LNGRKRGAWIKNPTTGERHPKNPEDRYDVKVKTGKISAPFTKFDVDRIAPDPIEYQIDNMIKQMGLDI